MPECPDFLPVPLPPIRPIITTFMNEPQGEPGRSELGLEGMVRTVWEAVLGFAAGVAVTVVIPLATWFFKPDWIRQRLGLDKAPEPDAYHVGGIRLEVLEADPVIGAAIRELRSRGREVSWQTKHKVPLKLQQGHELFRTPLGARVVYVREDSRGAETLVLVVKS